MMVVVEAKMWMLQVKASVTKKVMVFVTVTEEMVSHNTSKELVLLEMKTMTSGGSSDCF